MYPFLTLSVLITAITHVNVITTFATYILFTCFRVCPCFEFHITSLIWFSFYNLLSLLHSTPFMFLQSTVWFASVNIPLFSALYRRFLNFLLMVIIHLVVLQSTMGLLQLVDMSLANPTCPVPLCFNLSWVTSFNRLLRDPDAVKSTRGYCLVFICISFILRILNRRGDQARFLTRWSQARLNLRRQKHR